MIDTNKCGFSARILIILLAAALTIMLFASLKARIQNPHLTVAARPQQGMAGARIARYVTGHGAAPEQGGGHCARQRKCQRTGTGLQPG